MFASSAGAQSDGPRTDEEAIRLVYDAQDGCPAAAEFEARVRRASPHVRVVASEADVRVFTIRLDTSDTPRGQLSITKRDSHLGARQVVGATCDEVANILAFAVALAVDPNAVPLAESPALPDVAGLPSHASAPEKAAPDALSPAIDHPPSRTSWGIAAHAFAAPGFAPNTTFGAGISGEIGGTIGTLVPALRLGVEYGVSAPVASDGARVTFADALVLLDVCPTTFVLGALALRPCARIDGGARITASEDIPGAHSVTRPWIDVGPMVALRAHVAGPFFVAAEGGPLFPLLRDRVYFSPEITVHDVPSVAAHFEIAVGLAFR